MCWKTSEPKLLHTWQKELVENCDRKKVLEDRFVRKEKMKDVTKKKYIGDIISSDGQNCKNIRERTNQSNGTINNVVSSLTE